MTLTPRIDEIQKRYVRNHIINSDMGIWQRGTVFNSAATATYSADRFRYDKANTSAVHNLLQSTSVPTFAQAGYPVRYNLTVEVGTSDSSLAANEHTEIMYRMEGNDLIQLFGRKVRLAFWVLNSVVGTYPIAFRNASGTRSYVTTYTINQASTWEFKVIDLQLDTTGTWAFDNTLGMDIIWTLAAGTDFQTPTLNAWQNGNYFGHSSATNFNAGTVGSVFRLTMVGLYEGDFPSSVTVPYTRAGRNFQEELAMCQRYFEKSFDLNVTPENLNTNTYLKLATAFNTGDLRLYIPFIVPKRIAGSTVTFYSDNGTTTNWARWNGSGYVNGVGTSVSIINEFGMHVYAGSFSGLTVGQSWGVTGYYTVDAEL